mmetsp:Transcript_2815/g.4579  ORF Transcript_2815/g.4579 Transcript_2815/m.4579 type:complete len:390 (+) Transcript_2815:31-1200(+)
MDALMDTLLHSQHSQYVLQTHRARGVVGVRVCESPHTPCAHRGAGPRQHSPGAGTVSQHSLGSSAHHCGRQHSLLPEEGRRGFQLARERLDAARRDEQRVLELGGASTVLGGGGPPVCPVDVLRGALADHRLDGEDVPHLHLARLVVLVVQDVGRRVKDLADPVAAEVGDRGVSVRLDVVLDDPTDTVVGLAWLAVGDGFLPAVVRDLDELLARLVDLAHHKRLGAVAVVPVVVARDVDVDDVAVLELVRVRYAVADDLVDGGAARLGKAVVVERAGVRVALQRHLVDKRVDGVRLHSGGYHPPGRVQHLARNPASRAHALDVRGGFDLDLPREDGALRLRPSVARVVWQLDPLWHLSWRGLPPWPHFPRIFESVLGRRSEAAAHHSHL